MSAAIRLYEGLGFRRVPAFDRDALDLVGASSPAQAITALAYKLELGES
jgi:ribosomal protein S18 acetylase RimI-like enzyme